MEPICDRGGKVAAWKRGNDVLDLGGHYRLFIDGDAAYSYRTGTVRAWVRAGAFWTTTGNAIGFLRSATGLPSRPGLSGVPGRPGVAGRPGKRDELEGRAVNPLAVGQVTRLILCSSKDVA